MADQDPGVRGVARQRTESAWAQPLRKVVTSLLGPDESDAGPLTREHQREGACVVDCAVYIDGVRQPGEPTYAEAHAMTGEHAGAFVWLGLHEPTEPEMADIAAVFGLDDLALEHALTARTRPKIEHYGAATFFALRTTRYVEHNELTETSEIVETGSVMIFIGPQFVITVRHGAPGALGPTRTDLEARPELLRLGPWVVAHAICDRLVDTYLDVSTAVESDVDILEEHVYAQQSSSRIAQIYQLKRELMEFKRAVVPLQRPMGALVDSRDLMPKEIRRYFRDVNDHLLRVVERVAGLDDLLNSVLQARLAQVNVDQNNDMRKIAAWAAIAASQTAIAGVEGMNFHNMPELHTRYGYPIALLVMFTCAVVLYRMFRRSGWL